MLEELQRRHYSEATTRRYIRFIERFAQHFHRSPDRLGPQHIREYQAQLFTVHKLTPGSVTNHLCALPGDACAKSPSGYSPATAGTAAITPRMTRRPTTLASKPPAAPGLRNVSIPTCSAIALRPTCSRLAPTCTPFRSC